MTDSGSIKENKLYKSVLVIDDHKMIANGIKLIIGHKFEHFLSAQDGATGISLAIQHFPQLIILDHSLPDTNGPILARELRYRVPQSKILAYTYTYSQETILNFLQSGVNGYVIKKEDDDEFIKAVNRLLEGKDYFCKEARTHIVKRFSTSEERIKKHIIDNISFSSKEIDLIKLLCKQMTTKEIGFNLNLSERTVEQYRSNISRRIGAKNIAGIIKFALQNAIIDLDEL